MPQNDSRFELERGTGDLIDLLNDQDGEFYEDDHFELEDDWARLFVSRPFEMHVWDGGLHDVKHW